MVPLRPAASQCACQEFVFVAQFEFILHYFLWENRSDFSGATVCETSNKLLLELVGVVEIVELRYLCFSMQNWYIFYRRMLHLFFFPFLRPLLLLKCRKFRETNKSST